MKLILKLLISYFATEIVHLILTALLIVSGVIFHQICFINEFCITMGIINIHEEEIIWIFKKIFITLHYKMKNTMEKGPKLVIKTIEYEVGRHKNVEEK